MDKALGIKNTVLENAVLLASRLLLAAIFLHEGVFLIANFDAASAGLAKVGVPAPALMATTALQIVAGAAIAHGWHARSGAAALALFCLATAILFHTNLANRNELLHFEKDLAIAGGMFVLMLRGAGGLSLDAYARKNWTTAIAGKPSSAPFDWEGMRANGVPEECLGRLENRNEPFDVRRQLGPAGPRLSGR